MTDKRIQELIDTVKVYGYGYVNGYGWVTPTTSYLNNPDNFPFKHCRVRIGNKYGFINTEGRYLEVNGKERPFDYAESFSEGFAKVQIGYNYCFIKPNGTYLLVNGKELPFDDANDFSKGFTWVQIGSDEFLLSKYGFLFQNDRDLAKRVEQLILNEFPVNSMKYYIFSKFFS